VVGGRAQRLERQPRESAAIHAARVSATSHSRLFNRRRMQEHCSSPLFLRTILCSRPFHFPFTRCFSSSIQWRTTTMLAGVALGSPAVLSFIIRNRWPSADTS